MHHLVHQVKSFLHTSLRTRFVCLGGQDSRPSCLLRHRVAAAHGFVGKGNYLFYFLNPKQEKRSLILERKARMVDMEEIFQ